MGKQEADSSTNVLPQESCGVGPSGFHVHWPPRSIGQQRKGLHTVPFANSY